VLDYIFSNSYTYITIYQHNGNASPEKKDFYVSRRVILHELNNFSEDPDASMYI
jgi:hypothetical protein